MLTAFQSDAFQFDAFQIGRAQSNSGGFVWWPEARFNRKKEQIESFPEPVQEIILEAVKADNKQDRREILSKIEADIKFLRLYEVVVEQYIDALLEYELALQLKEAKRRQEEEIAVLLLL